MDTLPAETLAKIFSFCELDDRLIFESINNRIRTCIRRYAYDASTVLDVAYLQGVSLRCRPPPPYKTPPEQRRSFDVVRQCEFKMPSVVVLWNEKILNNDDDHNNYKKNSRTAQEEYVSFVLSLFEAVLPKVGARLRAVRFDDAVPDSAAGYYDEQGQQTAPAPNLIIEKEILFALHEYAPRLTSLDFGRRPIRLDAQRALLHFTNLRHLRILNAGDQFRETLVRIRGLVDLELAGVQRSIESLDVAALRRLVLRAAPRARRNSTTKYPLPGRFPELRTFHIKPPTRVRHYFDGGGLNGYADVDERARFFRRGRRFPRLRRSNLFGCRDVNIASMLAHKIPHVRWIRNLRIELPHIRRDEAHIAEVQHERERALAEIRSWPAFFDRFAANNIRTLRISNWNNGLAAKSFRVADLFNLPFLLSSSASNLRALTLDGLTFKLEDIERSGDILDRFCNAGCSTSTTSEADSTFRRLKKFTVKRSTLAFSFDREFKQSDKQHRALATMRSVAVLDVFVQFVLSTCSKDSLKKLHLECVDGTRVWYSVIHQYAKRFVEGAAVCPLESLRISWQPTPWSTKTENKDVPLPLADLVASGIVWPRLRQLRVDYSDIGGRSSIIAKRSCTVRSGIENTGPPGGGFAWRAIAEAFPRLRVFSWPYMQDSESVYQAVLKCPYLRRITIYDVVITTGERRIDDLARRCLISHRRLERVDMVRLDDEDDSDDDSATVGVFKKRPWDKMFEKRRILRRVDGLRESPVKVVRVTI